MKSFVHLFGGVALVASSAVLAQSGAWGQCGGIGWTGSTSCVSGYSCQYVNDWYSQCLPGSSGPSSTTLTTVSRTSTTATTTTTSTTITKTTSTTSSAPGTTSTAPPSGGGKGLRWVGVDESVAEFGQNKYPGTWGIDFYFPDLTTVNTLISEGYTMFRLPFAMERMAVGSLTADLDPAYLKNYTQVVDFITSKGAWAVIDPHNFGRYNGAIISDTAGFKSFWGKLATAFKSYDNVVFDTNNEYNTMDQTLVFNLNQAAIDGIRGAGATKQYIFAEGNSWSGAWTWVSVNDGLKDLKDPQNKLVYEMHQYLDSDGSGTSETCVSGTIGVERMTSATQWLRDNGKLGILGEFAGGANSVCKQAVTGLLDHLEDNSDVWLGALWWAAGPWWADYIYSFEPPNGAGYKYYDGLLKSYAS